MFLIFQYCRNPKDNSYKYYGGRGIKCLLTEKEVEFLWHRDNAINMDKPSIDRINNDGNYELSNCCFIEFNINAKKGNKLLLKYDKNYVNSVQIFQYRTYFIHVWQIKDEVYFTFETKNDRISCSSSSKLFKLLKDKDLQLSQFKLIEESYINNETDPGTCPIQQLSSKLDPIQA